MNPNYRFIQQSVVILPLKNKYRPITLRLGGVLYAFLSNLKKSQKRSTHAVKSSVYLIYIINHCIGYVCMQGRAGKGCRCCSTPVQDTWGWEQMSINTDNTRLGDALSRFSIGRSGQKRSRHTRLSFAKFVLNQSLHSPTWR